MLQVHGGKRRHECMARHLSPPDRKRHDHAEPGIGNARSAVPADQSRESGRLLLPAGEDGELRGIPNAV